MTQNICIYGTVYNNVNTIEKSIKSVWRPDATIVVVDNYSYDGTWEKLLEMRKEYNILIYRYNCSRGLGRQIALYKCPENSITTWFDLDTVYNDAFHRVINYAIDTRMIIHIGPLVARRELIINMGGWRDLNYGEDIELVSRIGFHVHIPILIGKNEEIPAFIQQRERRYGGSTRVIKSSIGLIRASALSLERLLVNKSKRGIAFYLPAKIAGFYRNRKPDNQSWIDKAILARAIPPRKAGVSEKYFKFTVSLYLLNRVKNKEEAIDKYMEELASKPIYKVYLDTREIKIYYFKDIEALGKEYLPLVSKLNIV
ncbi:MAG: glycosyltransferase [Desulfurococcaceae archaeon]